MFLCDLYGAHCAVAARVLAKTSGKRQISADHRQESAIPPLPMHKQRPGIVDAWVGNHPFISAATPCLRPKPRPFSSLCEVPGYLFMSLLSDLAKKSLGTFRRDQNTARATQVAHALGRVEKPGDASNLISMYGLTIDCPDPTAEEAARDDAQARGQFLARQDMWDRLTEEMRAADDQRRATTAGMPHADLLGFGARADVVLAVEHALYDGKPARGAPMTLGIEALEEVLSDDPTNAMLAMVVAQAHIDIGWAWRGTDRKVRRAARNLEAFSAHFDRATDLIDNFDAKTTTSPVIAGAYCALHGAGPLPKRRLEQDFERLIDLTPSNPAPLRAMGTYLSPKWFGDHHMLELEARRTAARTSQTWGAGGYTWVMFDALGDDDIACAQLDLEFFIEGLHDIVQRDASQHTVNLLAAYCAHTIGPTQSDNVEASIARCEIAKAAQWIVRDHLTELHPLIWAHAAAGFDNNLRIPSARRFAASGLSDSLRFIAGLFDADIARGRHIVFTADGPVTDDGTRVRH
jgi:hypothetical protein